MSLRHLVTACVLCIYSRPSCSSSKDIQLLRARCLLWKGDMLSMVLWIPHPIKMELEQFNCFPWHFPDSYMEWCMYTEAYYRCHVCVFHRYHLYIFQNLKMKKKITFDKISSVVSCFCVCITFHMQVLGTIWFR
jgi:hypothetical protein